MPRECVGAGEGGEASVSKTQDGRSQLINVFRGAPRPVLSTRCDASHSTPVVGMQVMQGRCNR